MSKFPLSLAILIAVIATIAAVWTARKSNEASHKAAGVAAIESQGGIVQFEPTLNVPLWLKTAIGEQHFQKEKIVDFATNQGRKTGTNEPKATDETLAYLASLTHVETLELANQSELTDSDLAVLAPLKNLTTLYLYRTGIRGPGLVHLERHPKLNALSLDWTEVDAAAMKHVGNMPGLTWLRLESTKVTDAGMADLAKASRLKMLALTNTDISDAGLLPLAGLQQLNSLTISGTRVTAEGVALLQKAIPSCRITTTFGLGVTPDDELLFSPGDKTTASEINARLKERSIDGEVGTDATRPGNPMVSLRLFRCHLSDRVVLALIEQMPDLEMLNLRHALVGDDFVKGLEALPIKYLSLQETRITNDALPYLSQLAKLDDLILSETKITDEGLSSLERLDQVTSMMLDHTRVTASGVRRLKQSLPKCRISW